MEIEKKYLISSLPDNLDSFDYVEIKQGYLSVSPVIRIRHKGDKAFLTYKGSGMMAREEIEKEIPVETFEHLVPKIDGRLIEKVRYKIPYDKYIIELDIFHGHKEGLIMAEVEFPSIEEADSFTPPSWFSKEVTLDRAYHNSNMI